MSNRPVEASTIRAYGDSVWNLLFTRTESSDNLTDATLTFTLHAGGNNVTPSIINTVNTEQTQQFKIIFTTSQKSVLLAGESSVQVKWQYSLAATGQAGGADVIGPEGSGYQGKFTLKT